MRARFNEYETPEPVTNPTVLKGKIVLSEGSVLQSSNYEAGTTGWIIRWDGTSEFN